jgi:hypothetical protein
MVPFALGHTCRLTLELVSEHAGIGSIRARCLWHGSVITTIKVKEGSDAEHAQMVPLWAVVVPALRAAMVPLHPKASRSGLHVMVAFALDTAYGPRPAIGGICSHTAAALPGNLMRKWKHKRIQYPRRIRFLFL